MEIGIGDLVILKIDDENVICRVIFDMMSDYKYELLTVDSYYVIAQYKTLESLKEECIKVCEGD